MVDEKFMARLFAGVVMVATLGWIVSFLAPIFVADYKPAPEVNIVMMAIVGIFVTFYNKAKNPKNPKDGGEDE